MRSVVTGFSNALEICRGKNTTVFEPKSPDEGEAMVNFVKEKRDESNVYIWNNYMDIRDQVSMVGLNDTVFLNSSYFGSLSTMAQMPKELWSPYNKEGTVRQKGYHCAVLY